MAIVIQTATSHKDTTSGTSSTFSHTCADDDDLMVFSAAVEDSNVVGYDTTTYNGVSATKINEVSIDTGTANSASLWYMLDTDIPAAGTYDVVFNYDESTGANKHGHGAVALQGAEQEAPEASTTKTDTHDNLVNESVTTLTDGAFIINSLSLSGTSTLTQDSPSSLTFKLDLSSAQIGMSHYEKATAGAQTTGWTFSGEFRQAMCIAAFAPAGAGGGSKKNTGSLAMMGVGV